MLAHERVDLYVEVYSSLTAAGWTQKAKVVSATTLLGLRLNLDRAVERVEGVRDSVDDLVVVRNRVLLP